MNQEISHEEWLSELERLGSFLESGPGMTLAEIAIEVKHSREWVRRRLAELQQQNRLLMSKRQAIAISGIRIWIPVYRLRAPSRRKK